MGRSGLKIFSFDFHFEKARACSFSTKEAVAEVSQAKAILGLGCIANLV